MSTETDFAKLTYPSLGRARPQEEFESARTRGHAAGYAAGLRKAAAEAEILQAAEQMDSEHRAATANATVSSALHSLESARQQVAAMNSLVLAASDAALAAAAIDLAEAIIGRELDDAESAAKAAVRRALSGAATDEVLALRLNPADLEALGDDARELQGLKLIADPTLERGDAVVDVPDGTIDARIGAALDRARRILSGLSGEKS